MKLCERCGFRKVYTAVDGEALWVCLIDYPKKQLNGEKYIMLLMSIILPPVPSSLNRSN